MDGSYTLEDAKAYERSRDYAKAADIYLSLGDYQKAKMLYISLEEQFPFHKDIKFKLGKLLTMSQDWDNAIIKLQEAGESGAFQEERLYLLAECFREKGFIHAAKEMYVELLDRNYNYKDAKTKFQALLSPGLAELAATQQTMIQSAGDRGGTGENALYQTMQGVAVEDRYALIDELGRGGMGVVYKAQDSQTNRLVAIKVLPPHLAQEHENRTRFFREAELIAQLQHPHIIRLFEVNRRHNFIVMEYLSGGTFAACLQQRKENAAVFLPLICQILDALNMVHQQGIIHRDLKPENILLVDQTTAKLTDFGIAHICGATITHTGTHLGTIPYMAPEQIIGGQIDPRADIYAVGVLLYELCTGQLPFSGKETSYHHIHTPPRAPRQFTSTLSADLEGIILQCLAKSPDDRFQNAKALQTAIETTSCL